MRFDEEGRELPSSDRVEVPLEFKRPPTLQEQMARMIRVHMSQAAAVAGRETFEEADDFDVMDDDGMPFSPHELSPEQEALTNEEYRGMLYARNGVRKGDLDESGTRGAVAESEKGKASAGGAERVGGELQEVEESRSKGVVDDRGRESAS